MLAAFAMMSPATSKKAHIMPHDAAAPAKRKNHRIRRHWSHPLALFRGFLSRPKLYWSIAAGIAVWFLTPDELITSVRAVLAWNVAAAIYLVGAIHVFSTCTHDDIRSRAAAEDETRFVFAALVMIAIVASLAGVVGLIGEATKSKEASPGYLVLGGLGVVLSWLVLQVVFTLHYAHDFYRPLDEPKTGDDAVDTTGKLHRGGLRFPDDDAPDYWDFLYFTTSIGATSQTSDVSITSKAVRRTVTLQALLSFAFNTAIVAFSINLAASLFQR